MSKTLGIRFTCGGAARAICADEHVGLLRELGFNPPQRASHVEPIASGPNAWQWLVDLSPLGADYQFCLWPPYDSREQALAAEHEFIQKFWVEAQF